MRHKHDVQLEKNQKKLFLLQEPKTFVKSYIVEYNYNPGLQLDKELKMLILDSDTAFSHLDYRFILLSLIPTTLSRTQRLRRAHAHLR